MLKVVAEAERTRGVMLTYSAYVDQLLLQLGFLSSHDAVHFLKVANFILGKK